MQFDLPWDIDTERLLEVLDEATRDDEEEKGEEAPEFGRRVVKFTGSALKKPLRGKSVRASPRRAQTLEEKETPKK